MADNQPIPLDAIHAYTDRELLLLAVDRLNGLAGEIRTFVGLLDNKVNRKEYDEHLRKGEKLYEEIQEELRDIKRRVGGIQNDGENRNVSETTIKAFKSQIWAWVLGFLAIMEFIVLVANSINRQ